MCGRFTQNYTWQEVQAAFDLCGTPRNLRPRYNIAPTTTVDVVKQGANGRELVPMRWGLIPSWWKKTAKEVPSTFNARAETVAEKPMFRSAFKRNRALVPCSGYYEWAKIEEGKQPYFIGAVDGSVLAIAGLWDQWKEPESDESLSTCTLIVTAANDYTRKIHDRMPVVLEAKDYYAWLSAGAGTVLLHPAPNDVLHMWPVSTRVNFTGRGDDDPSLIEPVGELLAAHVHRNGS